MNELVSVNPIPKVARHGIGLPRLNDKGQTVACEHSEKGADAGSNPARTIAHLWRDGTKREMRYTESKGGRAQ